MKYEIDILSFELDERSNEIRVEKNHEFIISIDSDNNLTESEFQTKCHEIANKIRM